LTICWGDRLDYQEFLESKKITIGNVGFGVDLGEVNDKLFPFQKDIVRWSLGKGKAAIFADCGLGKTAMQLEWSDNVCNYTFGDVLVLAPLSVAQQTHEEGLKFGIETNICREQADVKPGINIANYEMLHKFNPDHFSGVVLDESSILKSYSGTTKQQIIKAFKNTEFKLACTATPSPNDHMEILNHAAFLNVMESHEALAVWFINDTMNMGKYKLKGHAVDDFWDWVSGWAVSISRPSDLGYLDEGYILPPLNIIEEILPVETSTLDFNGPKKPKLNATTFHREKRQTLIDRVEKCAEIVARTDNQYMVWCDTNYEADALKKTIPNAVDVRGSDKASKKESAANDFRAGKIRVLISKPSIFGFGLNFQNCCNVVFCGLSFSYESFYQATRRFWRFGQDKEVNCHIVIGETEKQILDTVRAKETLFEEMKKGMVGGMLKNHALMHEKRNKLNYCPDKKLILPNWLRSVCA